MSKLRALLFDLDNTLVDFMKMKRAAVEAAIFAMIDAGLDCPVEQAFQQVWDIYDREGIESQEVFDHFLQNYYGRIDYKLLASAIIAYRRVREAALVLYPHVKSTLLELSRRGYRLAIISDAPALQAWLRLCSLGLQYYFETVITYDDTGERKPHPVPFLKALKTLDVKPDEAVMIGDWLERDMRGAKAVGMHTFYARYGCCHANASLEGETDFVLDDIADILEILDRNFSVSS